MCELASVKIGGGSNGSAPSRMAMSRTPCDSSLQRGLPSPRVRVVATERVLERCLLTQRRRNQRGVNGWLATEQVTVMAPARLRPSQTPIGIHNAGHAEQSNWRWPAPAAAAWTRYG